ncbi:MAG: hypothetical protein UW40_C0016G0009 [Parcubacteria group bacterium GW2011_GWF2_44_17]|nr:MAG: hypothetical protein UW40_C0016G0009 [Parcubacteria group bacterium GW2011_GWF2_44_17]
MSNKLHKGVASFVASTTILWSIGASLITGLVTPAHKRNRVCDFERWRIHLQTHIPGSLCYVVKVSFKGLKNVGGYHDR